MILSAPPLLLAALLACAPAAAQQPSTAAAPAQSPLFLTISKDSYSSRVGLDYRIRWDFSDLRSFKPGLGLLYSGLKAVAGWDITQNTRLEYYGLRTNPWRLILSDPEKRRAPAPAADGTAGAGGGSAVVSRPAGRRRVRLSLSPLVEDLKDNFDEGLRDYLLKSSMKDLSPEWERAGESGRRAFVKDVLSLGIWEAPVPVLNETRKGLEYISSEPPPKR